MNLDMNAESTWWMTYVLGQNLWGVGRYYPPLKCVESRDA